MHELHWKVSDPTWKYAAMHVPLLLVVQSCRAPAPVGHVVPSADVHAGVPSLEGDEDDELLQPPITPSAASARTRTFMPRS